VKILVDGKIFAQYYRVQSVRPSSKIHPNFFLRGDAMPTYNYTLGKITIDCECEQCGKPFSYEQKIEKSISSRYVNRPTAEELNSAATQLREKSQKILDSKKGLAIKKCPNCKQYQSWMNEGRQDGMALNIGLVTGILVGLVAGWITYSNVIAAKNTVTNGLIESIGLGIVSMLIVTAIIERVARPILRKNYHPKTTVSPERFKEPSLAWVEINKINGH
jgi:F0F1-type ATP synthase assembly protein I